MPSESRPKRDTGFPIGTLGFPIGNGFPVDTAFAMDFGAIHQHFIGSRSAHLAKT